MRTSATAARNAGKRKRTMDALRIELFRVQGSICAIPSCREGWTDVAHIDGSGSGGRPSTYRIDNVAGLCRGCHDILDGRNLSGRQALLRELLRTVVNVERRQRATDAPA